MSIFNLLSMLGGLALFLFGMHVMGDGLSRASGGRMEGILQKLTDNRVKAVLFGTGVTAVIQSSSATTVMVVGFVNAGVMKLSQAVGVIMGANIGTTVTSWLLSLTGINGQGLLIQLLKPSSFSPVLGLIGVALLIFSKVEKKQNIGSIMIGFSVLMYGMELMSSSVQPLADMPEFAEILLIFSNPLMGVLAGAVLTAIIQSSSAAVGILQALSSTGVMPYGTAIPVIMGQNIGTTVTALLSSIGASKNARRAAIIHLYFNIIGSVTFLVIFYGLHAVIHFSFIDKATSVAGIAIVHSVFNILATTLLLPFSNSLVKLAKFTIKDEEEEVGIIDSQINLKLLDPRFLETPALAIEQARKVTTGMALLTKKSIYEAMDLLSLYSEDKAEAVKKIEDDIDKYEDALGSYLVKVSQKDPSEQDSNEISILLHSLNDLERISDHAVNIMQSCKEMNAKGTNFSKKAQDELIIYSSAIREIVDLTVRGFCDENTDLSLIEPLEEVTDYLKVELKRRHIKRLRKGKCTIELGFILTDIITSYERVADHCSNIAACLLRIPESDYDTHEYLNYVKREDNSEYKHKYDEYRAKYSLEKVKDVVN